LRCVSSVRSPPEVVRLSLHDGSSDLAAPLRRPPPADPGGEREDAHSAVAGARAGRPGRPGDPPVGPAEHHLLPHRVRAESLPGLDGALSLGPGSPGAVPGDRRGGTLPGWGLRRRYHRLTACSAKATRSFTSSTRPSSHTA